MIESIKEDITHLILVSQIRATSKIEKEETKKFQNMLNINLMLNKLIQILPLKSEEKKFRFS